MVKTTSLLEKVYIAILLVIFGGIVLHAPLTVALSTLWPDASLLVKSWKEILMGAALLIGCVILYRRKQWDILRGPIIYGITAFAVLCLLLIPLFYISFEATVAGILTNLRFFLYFGLVYVALRLFPQYYGLFVMVFIAGAFVVIGFAVLQATVLPHDILKYLGYSKATIAPFLTVDENMDYIRINSTLRGPNPLGMYAVIVLTVALSVLWRKPRQLAKKEAWGLAFLVIGSVVALWASYSRSALLAAIVAVVLLAVVVFGKKVSVWVWAGLAALVVLVGVGAVVFRDTTFVSQVILHEDPNQGNNVNSNDGHAESLADGTARLLHQPFGAGIGSTGSASLLSDKGVIIENHYLFIAHETGWLGLALFITITIMVLKALWKRRAQWFALAVFASGIGLAVASFVLPVWADDTVSIIWWGMAAIALAVPPAKTTKPKKKARR